MVKDYAPKVFTREQPCSKVEIHNCFFDGVTYANRSVVEAHTVVGLNVPRYLLREGYAVQREINGVDMYCLTPEGDHWIRTGILRFLALHPERISDCEHMPIGYSRGKAGAKPTRTPQEATKTSAPNHPPRPVLRRPPRPRG